LQSLPALALAPLASAQTAAPIRVRGFNHVTLAVSDVQRSVDFYQGLFGLPVASRQGATVNLQIGPAQFLGISSAGTSAPAINHICLGVEDFNVDRLVNVLAQHGMSRSDAAGNAGGGGLGGGSMKIRVRMRGLETGGSREGTPEVYFSDPDGVVMQLQDPRYCGGAGPLGNICPPLEPSPRKGLLALRGWSHCTIFGSDAARANRFYQDLLGLRIQAYQGPAAPVLGVGGVQFLMFAGGGGRGRAGGPGPAGSINHYCMNMEGFNPDTVIKALETYGIRPRASGQGPVGPLVHYISLRMENRGGAKDGTPELYFTDPDGLLVQIQDTKYCGGGGVLGDVCL
jgi:catechol 2,3-dioxygenase-like lactoylglutathione lyase family enzyme